jgi:TolB-like protein
MGSREQFRSTQQRRLDSWKAIAQYLGRDVRSVQRWERDRGLPVHRVPGQKGGAVFAYESELEEWLRSGPQESGAVNSESEGEPSSVVPAANAPAEARRKLVPFLLTVSGIILLAVLALRWRSQGKISLPASESIAVLPLQNLSADATRDYFADGFTEELVTDLAQVHSLRVISRTSTMVYKGSKEPLPQIARELHVKYILEGSVALDGQRVRVTAQLINAATDTHLWAKTYDGDVKDVLDIQSQISQAIVNDVRLDLSPEEQEHLAHVPAVDPEAHDLYLKASYAYGQQTPDSIRQSLNLYKQAVAKDPGFAMAYLGIAQAETALLQITAEPPEESFRKEEEALHKALEIDPHLGDAHGMLASIAYIRDWDWPRAEHEFQLALAEGARAPTEQRYGSYLITRGRFAEGTAHLQAALELDPLGRSPRVNQFFGLYFQRKYSEARAKIEEILTTSPDFLAGHLLLGLASFMQHDCGETNRQAAWSEKRFPAPVAHFELALASACTADFVTARQHLEIAGASKPPTFASPYQLALGYAVIHDKNNALAFLEKSAAAHEPQILYLKVDPMFDEIRSDPRYVALERRVGLFQK